MCTGLTLSGSCETCSFIIDVPVNMHLLEMCFPGGNNNKVDCIIAIQELKHGVAVPVMRADAIASVWPIHKQGMHESRACSAVYRSKHGR
jgi:hypothetical protein